MVYKKFWSGEGFSNYRKRWLREGLKLERFKFILYVSFPILFAVYTTNQHTKNRLIRKMHETRELYPESENTEVQVTQFKDKVIERELRKLKNRKSRGAIVDDARIEQLEQIVQANRGK